MSFPIGNNNDDDDVTLGIACYERGEYDKAISYLTKSIANDPQNSIAYNIRGSIYLNKGK